MPHYGDSFLRPNKLQPISSCVVFGWPASHLPDNAEMYGGTGSSDIDTPGLHADGDRAISLGYFPGAEMSRLGNMGSVWAALAGNT